MLLRFFSKYSDTSNKIYPKKFVDTLKILPKFYQHIPRIFTRFSLKFLQHFLLTFHLFFANSQKFPQNIFKWQNTGSPYHYFHNHLLVQISHSVTKVAFFILKYWTNELNELREVLHANECERMKYFIQMN